MADNVPITAGSGTTVATDDVGGVHYQVVKQAFGVADSATLVSTTNPFPVNLWNTIGAQRIAETALNADATAGNIFGIDSSSFGQVYNGTTWDRMRGNTTGLFTVPKTVQPTAADSYTDRSGSVTTGGTAQQLAAANSSRRGLVIQNTSTGDLRITENATTATATTGYKLVPGASASVNTQAAISVYGATTGQTWAATEF